MGFPIGYSTEVFIPTLIIYTVTLLTIFKNIISSLFHFHAPPSSSTSRHRPPIAVVFLRQFLPVVRFEEELENSYCAVCLYDVCKGEEIRWLSNCRHTFHRDCLDRWIDLDHRTCPLCRTPFLGDRLLDELNQRLLAACDCD